MDFLNNLTPREYQQKIFEICKQKNCLVVLPTGLGKTLIALMLTIERMKEFPGEKVLFLAPTKPLAEQHLNYFRKNLPELFGDLQLFTGSVNADNRRKIWKTADIIFSTPQCVDGKTLIFTEEGPIEISEFFKKFKFKEENYASGKGNVAEIKEKVLGYDGKSINFLEASKAWKLPGKGLINLKTEIGNTLLCTKDHPILTINPHGELIWKEASQLNKGEYVASIKKINIEEKPLEILNLVSKNKFLKIADKTLIKELIQNLKEAKIKTASYSKYLYNFMPINLFLNLSKEIGFIYNSLTLTDNSGKSSPITLPKKMDFKLAYLLGAMLGDGHIGNRKNHGGEIVFSDLDRESVNQEMKNAFKELFNIEMKESPKGIVSYNSALASVLSSLGIPKGNKSKIIQIPKFLFFAEEKAIEGFIKGIFDTDGCASEYSVSISSVSKKFIQELKWLFLKIGISGNIEKRKNKENIIENRKIKESEIFTFRFSGRKNLQRFLEINPNKDKCERLVETLNKTKKPETRSKEILPVPKLMKRIRKTHKGEVDYYKFSCLSVDNLRKLTENLEGEEILKLKNLLNLPIRWVKIKEKQEYEEEREVYDLTIEKYHNFITNSLISHNCIANDLKKGRYNIKDVCLLIEDEAHRCIKNYDYKYIAQEYKLQAMHPRIIGLTASPGSEKSKIKEICKNLSIEEVELRTRESSDVKEYLQKLEFEKIMLDFPPEFEEIRHILLKIFGEYIEELRTRRILFGSASKTELILLQKKISGLLMRNSKNFNYMLGASACAQAIKIQHALELLETQTIEGFNKYIKSLFEQASKKKSKGVVKLVSKPEFNFVLMQSNELLAKKKEHPKLHKLIEITEKEKRENPNTKIIIFTQFRETANNLAKRINEIDGIRAKVFIGQAKKENGGLNQKQQKKIIQEFSSGKINVLCATCIAEEGLDIPEVNVVVFYEPIPSAIRTIQRTGRTARLMKGKLIMLVTKKTRDEAFFYVSRSREKKMKTAIEDIKNDFANENKIKAEIQRRLE